MPEYDLTALWRETCLANNAITAIIEDRAYPRHISEMPQPEFPCLSIYTLSEPDSFSLVGVRIGVYQFDSWAKDRQTAKDLQNLMRTMFQRVRWGCHNLLIMESYMTNRGDVLFEQKTLLYHGYSIYNVRWTTT